MVVASILLVWQSDARWMIAAGLVVMAAANYWMARMNLQKPPYAAIDNISTRGIAWLFRKESLARSRRHKTRVAHAKTAVCWHRVALLKKLQSVVARHDLCGSSLSPVVVSHWNKVGIKTPQNATLAGVRREHLFISRRCGTVP
jgi:hypothetical protein